MAGRPGARRGEGRRASTTGSAGLWPRRARGLALAALAGLGTVGPAAVGDGARAEPSTTTRRDGAGPAQAEARRRWALARMDEVAQDRLRCRGRFKKPAEVEACRRPLDREYRRYDETCLDAARE
jgi:hypothetical protein